MEPRVELFAATRRDARVEGLSIRELARRHQVHRRTVRQALATAEPPARKVPVRQAPKLDAFKPAIEENHHPNRHRQLPTRPLQNTTRQNATESKLLDHNPLPTTTGTDPQHPHEPIQISTQTLERITIGTDERRKRPRHHGFGGPVAMSVCNHRSVDFGPSITHRVLCPNCRNQPAAQIVSDR